MVVKENLAGDNKITIITSSTLAAVFADVSMKINPCSRANASPWLKYMHNRIVIKCSNCCFHEESLPFTRRHEYY